MNKKFGLVFLGILLSGCLGYFLLPRWFEWRKPPPEMVSLLRVDPDRMTLQSRFRDFRTEAVLDWTVREHPGPVREYVWRGNLETHPEFPGLMIRSGTSEIEAHLSLDSLRTSGRGSFVHFGSTLQSLPHTFRFSSNDPMVFPVHIPDASTLIRFEARSITSGARNLVVHLSIGEEWKESFPLSSSEWTPHLTSPIPRNLGNCDLSIQVEGANPGDRDVQVRNVDLREATVLCVLLPDGMAAPRVFYRPRDPMSAYLTGTTADFGPAPEVVESPWKTYDEDSRWVRPVVIQRRVRTGLFLPSPSEWTVLLDDRPASFLRFYPGVQNPLDLEAPVTALLRVHLETDGRRETLWEQQIQGTALDPSQFALNHHLQPWQVRKRRVELDQVLWRKGVLVPLPPSAGAERRVVFESIAPPGATAPAPLFLGEPVLLPPPRIEKNPPHLRAEEVLDWSALLSRLVRSGEQVSNKPERKIWLELDWETRILLGRSNLDEEISEATRTALLNSLNAVLAKPDLFPDSLVRSLEIPAHAGSPAPASREARIAGDATGFNRTTLDAAFPNEILPRLQYRPPPRNRPNVVVISLDTLRADALSCLGYHRETTPWMEKFFGRDGVRFHTASAPCTWTLPSHASLFLSQYVARHGVTRDIHSLTPSSETLAELLSRQGYETAAFVDRGFLHHQYGLHQGFHLYNQKGGGFAQLLPECLDFLKARDRTAPLFLFLHTFDIHDPYMPPHPYRERFLFGDMAPSRQDFVVPNADTLHNANRGLIELTRSDRDYARALYDGGVAYVDDLLGDFFETIEQRRLLENTVVILLSDHGEGFGEHGFWAHGWTLYEEMTRVPLLIRFPEKQFAGTEVEERVNLVDVAPTILEILDLSTPTHWQGDSLMPLIRDPSLRLDRRTYSQLNQNFAMYHGFIKLIEQRNPTPSKLNEKLMPPLAVYNLKEDPDERTNLVAAPPIDASAEFKRLSETMQVMTSQREAEGEIGEVILDEEQVEELQALGYLK